MELLVPSGDLGSAVSDACDFGRCAYRARKGIYIREIKACEILEPPQNSWNNTKEARSNALHQLPILTIVIRHHHLPSYLKFEQVYCNFMFAKVASGRRESHSLKQENFFDIIYRFCFRLRSWTAFVDSIDSLLLLILKQTVHREIRLQMTPAIEYIFPFASNELKGIDRRGPMLTFDKAGSRLSQLSNTLE